MKITPRQSLSALEEQDSPDPSLINRIMRKTNSTNLPSVQAGAKPQHSPTQSHKVAGNQTQQSSYSTNSSEPTHVDRRRIRLDYTDRPEPPALKTRLYTASQSHIRPQASHKQASHKNAPPRPTLSTDGLRKRKAGSSGPQEKAGLLLPSMTTASIIRSANSREAKLQTTNVITPTDVDPAAGGSDTDANASSRVMYPTHSHYHYHTQLFSVDRVANFPHNSPNARNQGPSWRALLESPHKRRPKTNEESISQRRSFPPNKAGPPRWPKHERSPQRLRVEARWISQSPSKNPLQKSAGEAAPPNPSPEPPRELPSPAPPRGLLMSPWAPYRLHQQSGDEAAHPSPSPNSTVQELRGRGSPPPREAQNSKRCRLT